MDSHLCAEKQDDIADGEPEDLRLRSPAGETKPVGMTKLSRLPLGNLPKVGWSWTTCLEEYSSEEPQNGHSDLEQFKVGKTN